MSKSLDYTDHLLALFNGVAGEFEVLDIRQFNEDTEAHNSELQEQYWSEMSANFYAAIAQGAAQWGNPVVQIRDDHSDADLWNNRTNLSFIELAAWSRDDGKYFFVLIDHEDRECPILLLAGITK